MKELTMKSNNTQERTEINNRNTIAGQPLRTLSAYKRSPALSNSTWYKGILCSQMAGTADNNGAFDAILSKMRRGTEPPPHVHSREDEFFYILSGEMRVYVDGEVFQVRAGECMFLPRRKPHAFVITSDELHSIVTITPGGFFDAINKMNVPAERMDIPTDVDTVTYANADLADTIKVFEQYEVRLLNPDEIHAEMPQYPVRVDAQGSRQTAAT
jgi:mannose-6-phosphate isomerase-like protein (cupin superfamily)